MKVKMMILGASLLTGVTASASVGPDINEMIVDIQPRAFFMPNGFDDNDDVVAVVDGYLPDSCYRLRRADVTVEYAAKKILVQPKAQIFPGPCMDVTIPYATPVNLGPLPSGTYTVTTRDGSLIDTVTVGRASFPGPDDHLYAPIDSVQVRKQPNGTLAAVVQGRFMSTCYEMQEVRIINSGKTFEVLPMMHERETTATGAKCEKKEIQFERTVPLPALASGRFLLHVRSLNGQSVNEVFSNNLN